MSRLDAITPRINILQRDSNNEVKLEENLKTALSDDFVRGGVIVRPDFQRNSRDYYYYKQ